MAKKVKMVSVSVPKHYRDKVESLLRSLKEKDAEAKPVKREARMSVGRLRAMRVLSDQLLPQLKALQKEEDRIADILDQKLTAADRQWFEAYEQRLGRVSTHIYRTYDVVDR